MIEISRAQLEMLGSWFRPETPGPSTIAAHFLRTGLGHAWVDRWPNVQVVVVEASDNILMVGDPAALEPSELAQTLAGYVAAPATFLPVLESAFPTLIRWPRLIGTLSGPPAKPAPVAAELRRFSFDDANDLNMLSAESIWVARTWGGGPALAQSGYGWGAWVDGRLASVACTFLLGAEYEEIGVTTEPGYQGEGLSTACSYELCLDIMARGRIPSWSTSTDNRSSWRVAQKLGFVHQRNDWLYVVGRENP
ncbi:MAG: GNAT family N-acetyltransferase [Caldilineaceae bacterium]|nr:GNAT family N-acetyltransferase [Caldilineaceae bacterium]